MKKKPIELLPAHNKYAGTRPWKLIHTLPALRDGTVVRFYQNKWKDVAFCFSVDFPMNVTDERVAHVNKVARGICEKLITHQESKYDVNNLRK